MSKKSFILYLDQQALFNKLPDEVAGKLIKHIFSYVNCEDPITDDLVLDIAFESIKQALKRDLKSWESQRKQRSDAGKRSAATRANEKQRKATKSTSVESRSTKSTVSVNGSVSVNVSDKDKRKAFAPPTIEVLQAYITSNKLDVDADVFIDHYKANGWVAGKTKMKDWKATARNWSRRGNKNATNNRPHKLTAVERVEAAGREQERRENEQIDITPYSEIVGENGADIRS